MEAAQTKAAGKSDFAEYDYSNFYYGAGDDPLNLLRPYADWYREARPNGYYLYQEALGSAPTTHVRVKNGKTGRWQDLLNLASYNYLGISYRPEVKKAAAEALEKYGLGASGSPILSGTFDVHEEFAAELARFKDKEACIVFPTGYSANVGFISALMRSGDTIFLDQYSHASIVDGAILAKSRTVFFRHNNALDLERKIAKEKGKKLVVVEGVYSMDGDMCALARGPRGHEAPRRAHADRRGALHVPVRAERPRRGRALRPRQGGGLPPRHVLEEPGWAGRLRGRIEGPRRLRHGVRPLALLLLQPLAGPHGGPARRRCASPTREPQLRARLWSNVAYLRRRFAEEGVDIGKSNSQVMPVMVNNDAKVFAVAEKIQDRGLFLNPVTYPAVPKHKSRLRISVSAAHTEEDLETAAQTIAGVLREEGICR